MTDDMTTWAAWMDIAQKVGSGGAFVMGCVLYFLWPAYREEVKYSKERDKQTLEVLFKLTQLLEVARDSDKEGAVRDEKNTRVVLDAISVTQKLIEQHIFTRPSQKQTT